MDNYEITWEIHNFNVCWHKTGEWLDSSLFKTAIDHEISWKLRLYPRGEDDGEYISCYLIREEGGPEVVDIDFEFFLKIGITEICVTRLKMHSFKIHQRAGHARLAPRSILSPDAAFKDTFVLSFGCRIFKGEIDMNKTSFLLITRIEMEHIYGTESFDDDKDIDPDCKKDIEVKPMLEDESLMNINLYYVEESLVIKIRPVNCEKIKYAICKIVVIKNWGKESPIEHVRSWIGKIKSDVSRYTVLLPERESSTPDFNTSSDKVFFMHYDFIYSNGKAIDICVEEYCKYQETHYFSLQQYFNNSIKIAQSAPTALDALEEVYRSESFFDFYFESDRKTYKVHKAIVCARSPIFKSIINKNHSGTTLIPLSGSECYSFIMFLYTDTVEFSFSSRIAAEFFSIASFLKIELLKTKCRNFLKDQLDLQHIDKLLDFLTSIGDLSLKSAVENFVVKHYDLILRYTNWKVLRDEPELCKEIMLLKYKKQKTIQMYNAKFV